MVSCFIWAGSKFRPWAMVLLVPKAISAAQPPAIKTFFNTFIIFIFLRLTDFDAAPLAARMSDVAKVYATVVPETEFVDLQMVTRGNVTFAAHMLLRRAQELRRALQEDQFAPAAIWSGYQALLLFVFRENVSLTAEQTVPRPHANLAAMPIRNRRGERFPHNGRCFATRF